MSWFLTTALPTCLSTPCDRSVRAAHHLERLFDSPLSLGALAIFDGSVAGQKTDQSGTNTVFAITVQTQCFDLLCQTYMLQTLCLPYYALISMTWFFAGGSCAPQTLAVSSKIAKPSDHSAQSITDFPSLHGRVMRYWRYVLVSLSALDMARLYQRGVFRPKRLATPSILTALSAAAIGATAKLYAAKFAMPAV